MDSKGTDWRDATATGAQALPTAAVTDEMVQDALAVVDGWFRGGDDRIEWETVWDRLEGWGYDMGDELDSPGMRKVQREVRKALRAG